ncbi:MAG: hypothetical protein MUF87_18995 [Anaerolineae bacterium]|nr:hypothetical protein [Anaerolineae bacterium]
MKHRLALLICCLSMIGMIAAIVSAQTTTPTPTPGRSTLLVADAFVRSGPGDDFTPVGRVTPETALIAVNRDSTSTWVLIRYNRGFGWIRRDLVFWVVNIDALPALNANVTPSPIPGSPTPTAFFPTSTPTGDYILVNAQSALVRAGPGRTYLRLGQLLGGDPVSPLGRDANITWIMIEFAGGFGWIRADLAFWVTDLETLPVLSPDNLTPSPTSTLQATLTAIAAINETNIARLTATAIRLETEAALATATFTPTETPLPTNTLTPTYTATLTPLPTETATPTLTLTPLPSATFTATPVPTETETATPVPTETQTSTPVSTETETPTFAPTETETETATPAPTEPIAPLVVATTLAPTPTETIAPTITESPEPTLTASPEATNTATLTTTFTATPDPTDTLAPASVTPTPTLTETIEAVIIAPTAGSSVTPDADAPAPFPIEAIIAGIALIAVVIYILLYLRGVAIVERYEQGFVIDQCPVCRRGELLIDSKPERIFGIPNARRTIRCTNCRSVLREIGDRRWRYAIDRLENVTLYERLNNREIDEETLMMLLDHPTASPPPTPITPPQFMDNDQP